jgi:hypothetical protein
MEFDSSISAHAKAERPPLYRAQILDREADALLQQGRHRLAEHLAEVAAELRRMEVAR